MPVDHALEPGQDSIPTEMGHEGLSFDLDAFDALIRSQGVQMVHYRALGCPVGMAGLHDSRRVHDDHAGCSGGFIYKRIGLLTMAPSGNTKSEKRSEIGTSNDATLRVSLPTTYDDRPDLFPYVAFHDRLYLNEDSVVTPQWEKVQASDGGVDKLRFQAQQVQNIIDSSGKEYGAGDFAVREGKLAWLGANRPAPGTVYVCWYTYKPFYYVYRFEKEMRISQTDDGLGHRVTARLPQSVVLQREYVFEVNDNDPNAPPSTDGRQAAAAVLRLPAILNPANPFGRS